MRRVNVRAELVALVICVVCAFGCPAASAAEVTGEPGQITMAALSVDEMARSVLPARVELPLALSEAAFAGERTARLAELKYCGAGDKRAGRFRAVVLQNNIGQVQRVLAVQGSCQASLGDLAKPAASLVEQGQSLAIADVDASYKASELKLSVVRAVVVHGGRKSSTEIIDKRIDLPAVSLSLRFDVGGSAWFAHVVPSFADSSVSCSVAIGEHHAGGATARLEGKATLAAEVPLSTANMILRRLSTAQQMTIELDADSIELRTIVVSGKGRGADAKVTVTGTATPKSLAETVDWTLRLAGSPLQVSSVEAGAHVEDCSALASLAAVACNLRNGARVSAAQAFASALTNRYAGRFLHELASPLDTRFSVAGHRLHLSGDVLQVAGGQNSIAAAGNVSAVIEE